MKKKNIVAVNQNDNNNEESYVIPEDVAEKVSNKEELEQLKK